MKTFHTDVSALTGFLFNLERRGRYDEALAELRSIWTDTDQFPDVGDYAPRAAAELFLRCGAVIGFLGQIKQIPNSQERSKNLITEARRRYLELYDTEKVAECENYLALAYIRTGELGEAETWIEEALSHNIENLSDAWLYAQVSRSFIFLTRGENAQVVATLRPLEKLFERFGNHYLLGSFCTNLSVALKNLDDLAGSLRYLELARRHHQKSEHQIYLGTVENNLSQLYKLEGRFREAHQTIDSATRIFNAVRDRTREGFSLDTKADIFFAEGRYAEALEVIDKAVFLLSKSENASYIVETYLSKAKILLYLENLTSAFLCLSDAVQIAKTRISEERARHLVERFEALMTDKATAVAPVVIDPPPSADGRPDQLELVLHPTIAHYRDFQGVWINNPHLEKFGLRKGSLAVVTKDAINRGDLVALTELATNAVVCGFYDSDFGLVCLEGVGDEPVLYDADEIEILGKVIGVGHAAGNQSGKLSIEPLGH